MYSVSTFFLVYRSSIYNLLLDLWIFILPNRATKWMGSGIYIIATLFNLSDRCKYLGLFVGIHLGLGCGWVQEFTEITAMTVACQKVVTTDFQKVVTMARASTTQRRI